MELLFTLGGLIAIAIVLYLFMSQRGKRLSWGVKCLILSVLVALLAALWCIVYGPDLWILIQAGILIVVGTVASVLSARKGWPKREATMRAAGTSLGRSAA